MSSIGWVAFSEKERQRTLDVLSMFNESGAIDEIGIGRIRDAFSDLLFPGTSTIQTRARYFLIVPWIYRAIEHRSPVSDAGHEVWKLETKFIRRLDEAGEEADRHGMIGSSAGVDVRQLPSQIYWQGMLKWGIRKQAGPRSLCHRQMSVLEFTGHHLVDAEEDAQRASSWWDQHLAPEPEGFWDSPTLAMSEDEASYLREAIAVSVPGTLLAHLALCDHDLSMADGPWDLPPEVQSTLDDRNRDALEKARAFSIVMNGASVLFNLMLAEKREEQLDWLDRYERRGEEWVAQMEAHADLIASVFGDQDGWTSFWAVVRSSNPRVPGIYERAFIENWVGIAAKDPEASLRLPEARDLVRTRELRLKGPNRAKLSNAAALEYYQGGNGALPLDYRWSTVRQLLADMGAERSAPEKDAGN